MVPRDASTSPLSNRPFGPVAAILDTSLSEMWFSWMRAMTEGYSGYLGFAPGPFGLVLGLSFAAPWLCGVPGVCFSPPELSYLGPSPSLTFSASDCAGLESFG